MRGLLPEYAARPEHDRNTWYALYIGKATQLTLKVSLQTLHLTHRAWIPTYQICQVKKNDIVTVAKKAFPGYAFITFLNTEPTEHDALEAYISNAEFHLKNQDPQFKFLRQPSGTIAQVPHTELDGIEVAVEVMNQQQKLDTNYKVGDFIRIISGPFADTIGQVEDIKKKTVVLRIFFLNKKQIRMEVPVNHAQFIVDKQYA